MVIIGNPADSAEARIPGEPVVQRPAGSSADCYSAGERGIMEWYQEWRAVRLRPFLETCTRIGISPDHLSALSLVLGLAFCGLYFWSPIAAFVVLLGHLVVDGLDGPLARYQKVASRAGSLTDTFCDQIVVALTTIVLMPDVVRVWAGGVYVFLYTLVVVFAMVRNAMQIPYSRLFRPRIVIYAGLAVEVFFLQGTSAAGAVNYLIWIVNGILTIHMVTGFARLRQDLQD